MCAIALLGVVGCSNKAENEVVQEKVENEVVQEQSETTKKDIPNGLTEEVGEGNMFISTPGGTSENGNIPTIFVEEDTMLLQIALDSENFDGSKLSYIYVDGMLTSKEQLGEMSQVSVDLKEKELSQGEHSVEVVQYDNNEAGGNIITYKKASYNVSQN